MNDKSFEWALHLPRVPQSSATSACQQRRHRTMMEGAGPVTTPTITQRSRKWGASSAIHLPTSLELWLLWELEKEGHIKASPGQHDIWGDGHLQENPTHALLSLSPTRKQLTKPTPTDVHLICLSNAPPRLLLTLHFLTEHS